MKSRLVGELRIKTEPVAILWSDEKPAQAREFKPGKWGCVMWMLAAAAKGNTAVFSEQTYGCWGGGVGLGFGNQYRNFPGGEECFACFLSDGNAQCEPGRITAERIKNFVSGDFLADFNNGERYLKSPELVRDFVEALPMMRIPTEYVVFKPLAAVDPDRETPEIVVLLAPPDQLAALVILANYGRKGTDNVAIPYAAGCQTIGIFPYREAKSANPRAIVGLTDISARENLRSLPGRDLFSFAVPWRMFLEMEADVEGSFLQGRTWRVLAGDEGK